MKSVMQQEKKCYICGANGSCEPLEEHHIFFGTANKKISEKYGLKVKICAFKCHRLGPNSIHKNYETNKWLKQQGQKKFEETHSREEFMRKFGKNWL